MTIARNSSGQPYECAHDWGDVSVQCGGNGLVLGKHGSRRTAFFEAFPADPKTFIRGEGKTIGAAEDAAWRKWLSIQACADHDYRRHGDRHGICARCGLFTSYVFAPEADCATCGKSQVACTGPDRKTKFCLRHYIEACERYTGPAVAGSGLEGFLVKADDFLKFTLRRGLRYDRMAKAGLVDLDSDEPDYLLSDRVSKLVDAYSDWLLELEKPLWASDKMTGSAENFWERSTQLSALVNDLDDMLMPFWMMCLREPGLAEVIQAQAAGLIVALA